MRSMTSLVTAVVFVVVSGCSSQSIPGPAEQASLDDVAKCFHYSVTRLQREPETPGEFAACIREVQTQAAASGDGLEEAFFRLRWDESGRKLLTPSGREIECRISAAEEDLHDDGSSLFRTYEFVVPQTELRATTTIELSVRR